MTITRKRTGYGVLFCIAFALVCIVALPSSAKAAYRDIPTWLGGVDKQYINIGDIPNDPTTGQGGNVERSYIKAYTEASTLVTGRVRNIPVNTVNVSGGSSDCGQVRRIYYQFWKYDGSELGLVQQSPEYEMQNLPQLGVQCGLYNIPISDDWFTATDPSIKPEHAGLATVVIKFRIHKYVEPGNYVTSYMEINRGGTSPLGVPYPPASPEIHFGYKGLQPATLLPDPASGTNTLSWVFAPPCTYGGGIETLSWFETDFNTTQQPAAGFRIDLYKDGILVDIPGAGVHGLADYSIVNGRNGDLSGFVPPGGWAAASKYELRMTGVKGGNGISVGLPFDSGDFYLGCPVPFDSTGTTGVTVDDPENPTNVKATATINRAGTGTNAPIFDAYLTVTKNDVPVGTAKQESGSAWGWAGNLSLSTEINDSGGLRSQGWKAGDKICSLLNYTYKSGLVVPNEASTVSQGQPSGPITGNCEYIVDKPYVRVYGSDVLAGSGFAVGDVCSASPTSQIKGYVSRFSDRSGSGVQFAALAMNSITGFYSAALRPDGVTPTFPNGLSISNNTANLGNYQGTPICSSDFWGEAQYDDGSSLKSNRNGATLPLASLNSADDGKQTLAKPSSGKLTINGTSGFDIRHTIFVDGDLRITSNVEYQDFTDPATASALAVVVRGNIYIDKSVTRLDGMYVAQKKTDGSGGTIYTCADGFDEYKASDGAAMVDNCSSQLTINGAFVSDSLKLLRTANTISDSLRSDQELSGVSKAAEVFNFTPEIYISSPPFKEDCAQCRYKSYETLPPIL